MIVIPMAGMSSRFFKEGYTKPKYMLEAHGKTLFEYSVLSFKNNFLNEKFLFIVKNSYDTEQFVSNTVTRLGIKNYYIVSLNDETQGQAETVALGLDIVLRNSFVEDSDTLTIFNIDTFRENFNFPILDKDSSGYLEVFMGDGSNWSFAKPLCKKRKLVSETAEKKPISNLCSTGLYHFVTIKLFLLALDLFVNNDTNEWVNGELYIAPLYNELIKNGYKIHYNLISSEEVIFCGTPEEYITFCK